MRESLTIGIGLENINNEATIQWKSTTVNSSGSCSIGIPESAF